MPQLSPDREPLLSWCTAGPGGGSGNVGAIRATPPLTRYGSRHTVAVPTVTPVKASSSDTCPNGRYAHKRDETPNDERQQGDTGIAQTRATGSLDLGQGCGGTCRPPAAQLVVDGGDTSRPRS